MKPKYVTEERLVAQMLQHGNDYHHTSVEDQINAALAPNNAAVLAEVKRTFPKRPWYADVILSSISLLVGCGMTVALFYIQYKPKAPPKTAFATPIERGWDTPTTAPKPLWPSQGYPADGSSNGEGCWARCENGKLHSNCSSFANEGQPCATTAASTTAGTDFKAWAGAIEVPEIKIVPAVDCWIGVTDAKGRNWIHDVVKASGPVTIREGMNWQKGETLVNFPRPLTVRSGCPGKVTYFVDGRELRPANLSKTPAKSEVVEIP